MAFGTGTVTRENVPYGNRPADAIGTAAAKPSRAGGTIGANPHEGGVTDAVVTGAVVTGAVVIAAVVIAEGEQGDEGN